MPGSGLRIRHSSGEVLVLAAGGGGVSGSSLKGHIIIIKLYAF